MSTKGAAGQPAELLNEIREATRAVADFSKIEGSPEFVMPGLVPGIHALA